MRNVKRKDKVIQFYRGIGCLFVVGYHFLYRYGELYNSPENSIKLLSNFGSMGVALFLVLTGYFIVTLENISMISQLKRKIINLYPAYVIAVTVSFIISKFGYLGEDRVVEIKDYLLNIILVNGFISKPYVDGAHWYITYIVIFAIFFAYFNNKKISDKPSLYISWLVINLVAFLIAGILKKYNFLVVANLLYMLAGNKYLGFVIAGVCIKFIENVEDQKEKNIWKLVLISSLIFILISYRSIVMFTFGVVFLYALYIRRYLLVFRRSSLIIYIGNMSYGIYLIHQNVGYSIMNYLKINFGMSFIFRVFVAFIFVMLLGILINSLSESVSIAMKKSKKYMNVSVKK